MEMIWIIILIIFGILFGIISSLAGIGGGALYMSVMIIIFAIPINEARNTSTFIISLFSGFAFITYYRQGKVDLKVSIVFAGFALLGSISATIIFIAFPIDNIALKIVIASVILISGLNMIRKAIKHFKSDRNNNIIQEFSFENFDYKTNLEKGIPLFFLAGFVAHLSGIGGGMIFVPILTIAFGIPIHFATAISTTMIFFLGIYNASTRIFLGTIHYDIGILIGIGAIAGALVGAKFSKKISKSALQFFVAIVLISLSIRMFFV